MNRGASPERPHASRSRRRVGRVAGRVGGILCCAAVALAPLAVGGVHRGSMILLLAAGALALALVAGGAAVERRPLRIGRGVALPLVLLVIPCLQSIALPLGLRGLLDPAGNTLLLDGPEPLRFWPLSLDPTVTREHVGKAAAALAVFLIAYHLAAGRTRRHLLPRLVAITGIVTVAIGLGHRIFGYSEIYGTFKTQARSLLAGPFVNANHTAEFLELAAFACLACSFRRNTILNRYGWLTGMLLCTVGAVGTLSRGSVAAVLVGLILFVFLRRFSREEGTTERARTWVAWAVLIALVAAVTAGALGAGTLIDRFRSSSVTHDVRFRLWRDSLSVLFAHPVGIGRGAFERVYPAYRTLKTSIPVTFAYVESHPLQLLIDCGWPMFGGVVAGVVIVLTQIVRLGRRDKIEAAFLGGLFAVVAHSCVDFGLETLGVLLPFVTILGTVLGRGAPADAPPPPRRVVVPLVALSCAGLLFGIGSLAHSSSDDFDAMLKRTRGKDELQTVLRRAQAVHPTDYFYALAYAGTEPLRPAQGSTSLRLHALNHALRLCPGCDIVHAAVARSLWQLGSRSQALIEWRSAVELQPSMFHDVLEELARGGAKPQELAAIATFDPDRLVDVARFLAARRQVPEALQVLDQADAMGASRPDSLLTRCDLQLQSDDVGGAQATAAQAHATGIQDPRLMVLEAKLTVRLKGRSGVDEALAKLDLAAMRYPLDLEVQRTRLTLVSDYERWQVVDRAIDGLKRALYGTSGNSFEANLAAARIRSRLSQWNASFTEYRLALSQLPGLPSVWAEFGQVAERAGQTAVARDAYSEAARLAPLDPQITAQIRRLDSRQSALRGPSLDHGSGGAGHVP